MTTQSKAYPAATTPGGTNWTAIWAKTGYMIGRILLYLVLAAGAIVFSAPLLWMISTSLKPEGLVYQIPIVWIPPEPRWDNYSRGWNVLPFATFYANTAFITVVNIIGLVFSSSLVAFGFARIRFWMRNTIFIILLATMMLPSQVTLIPIYLFWATLGAVNTFWPLIVPQWLTNAYNVFLLRQFFMSINTELDDAARIDGAGWLRIYWNILMPLSKPALGVIAIQAFAWNWNNFFDPLIYLNEPKNFTIAIGLRLFQTQQSQRIPETMAMTVVALIPVLIVFYIAQAKFIQGIVISGVKG
ncbi:MAG: sugar ABC transporter ATP-binding protein [Chloroflexi bacterium]|nr:MAG: sugar ABC transporter ATP-binding protein [Chloroflexota bacterium]